MPAPLRHVNVGQMMGSWPFIPLSTGPGVVLQSRSLRPEATILGSRRETISGFSVVGLSFYLWVDDILGVPQQHSITFTDPGPGYLTLGQVVTQINTSAIPALPGVVAFKDNGFLRLSSPHTGEKSYLRLQRDPASSANVFVELGLFAEIVAHGGDLTQAPAVDPDRQPVLPGQLAWGEGEQFEARVFNRMAFQLAVNTDLAHGILDRKRVATRTELTESSYVVQSPADEGLQLTGFVYTGNDGPAPTIVQLEKHFAVLDGSGREFMREMLTVLNTQTGNASLKRLENGLTEIVLSPASFTFPSSDAQDPIYVRITTVPGFPALDGAMMKIQAGTGAGIAVVQPIDPATGSYVYIGPDNEETTIAITSLVERVRVDFLRCEVDGVYDVQGGTRVEGLGAWSLKHANVNVTRVELNNRVFCSGATFVTGASPVVLGDRVVWSSHSVLNPYTNNGEYRISAIVDDETLELVDLNWDPVFLNPDTGGSLGQVLVTTDGLFWDSPFIRFNPTGAIPDSGDYVKVVYREMTTLRVAMDNPAIFDAASLLYDQEADDTIQRAILKILGPSATSIDDYVRSDTSINLEQLDIRLDKEHYEITGRHSTIHPDVIDMQVELPGLAVTVRADNSDAPEDTKVRLLSPYLNKSPWTDPLTADPSFTVSADGWMGVGLWETDCDDFAPIRPGVVLPHNSASDGEWVFGTQTYTADDLAGVGFVVSGATLNGTFYYAIQAVYADSSHSKLSNEVSVTVNGAPNNAVELTWYNATQGEHSWRVWKGVATGVYTWRVNLPKGAFSFVDNGNITFTGDSPQNTSTGYSAKVSSRQASWLPLGLTVGSELQVFTKTGITTEFRPSGLIGGAYGSGYQQYGGAPIYRSRVGQDVNTSYILREEFRYLTAASGWPEFSNYRIDHSKQNITYAGETGGTGSLANRIQFELWSGEIRVVKDGSSFVTGGMLTLAGNDPTFLKMCNLSDTEGIEYGISTGNFYADSGVAGYFPYVVDLSTGYTGMGAVSATTAPLATLHLWNESNAAILTLESSDDGYPIDLRIGSGSNHNFYFDAGVSGFYQYLINPTSGYSAMGAANANVSPLATLHLYSDGTRPALVLDPDSTSPTSGTYGGFWVNDTDKYVYEWSNVLGVADWLKLALYDDIISRALSNLSPAKVTPTFAGTADTAQFGIADNEKYTISCGARNTIFRSLSNTDEIVMMQEVDLDTTSEGLQAIACKPATSTVWMAVGNGYSGGSILSYYTSVDDGSTWSSAGTDVAEFYGIIWHAYSSSFISVGGQSASAFYVLKSTYSGSWTHTPYPQAENGTLRGVAANPGSGLVVAVGTLGASSAPKYIYSTDSGVTWSSSASLPSAGSANASAGRDVCWDPVNSRFVALSNDFKVWVSTNGSTWTRVYSSPSGGWGHSYSLKAANRIRCFDVGGRAVYVVTFDDVAAFAYSFNLAVWFQGNQLPSVPFSVGTSVPYAQYYCTAASSALTTTFNPFNATGAGYSAISDGILRSAGVLTVELGGVYKVDATFYVEQSVSNYMGVFRLRKNGSTTIWDGGSGAFINTSVDPVEVSVSFLCHLAAGDTLQFEMRANNGTTDTLTIHEGSVLNVTLVTLEATDPEDMAAAFNTPCIANRRIVVAGANYKTTINSAMRAHTGMLERMSQV